MLFATQEAKGTQRKALEALRSEEALWERSIQAI